MPTPVPVQPPGAATLPDVVHGMEVLASVLVIPVPAGSRAESAYPLALFVVTVTSVRTYSVAPGSTDPYPQFAGAVTGPDPSAS